MTNLLNIPESLGERQKALAGEYGRPRSGNRTVSHDLAALQAADDETAAWRSDVKQKIRITERNVALGLQGKADLDELRRRKPPVRRPAAGTVLSASLLRHMREHYSDYQLRNDLDCVLSLCASETDRKAVRQFARTKLAGKPYEGLVTLDSKTCESCRKPFSPRRSTARFCGTTCRQRGRRRNPGGHVTLSPSLAA